MFQQYQFAGDTRSPISDVEASFPFGSKLTEKQLLKNISKVT